REEAEGRAILDVVHDLGRGHPSRSLVMVLDADPDRRGLDIDVRVHIVERNSHAVCFEDLAVRAHGPVTNHLDSVVEPLSLPDVPVALWWPSGLPELGDPLLAVADRVIVDSRAAGGIHRFPDVSAIARRVAAIDLSWIRLTPWRELMAGLFEGEMFRPF